MIPAARPASPVNNEPPKDKSASGTDLMGTGAALDDGAIETGRRLFAGECRFLLSVTTLADLPEHTLPEIAFAGRSNVGKSSLVNALTGRKTLARTSNTPGRTRAINLFLLGERLYLADLPGYGFARAGKTEVAHWTRLVETYLKGRPALRRVCLLIDARHGIKPTDEATMTGLDTAAVVYQIVLTKSDKLSGAALQETVADTQRRLRRHVAAHPVIVATSAVTGLGIAELRAQLAALSGTEPLRYKNPSGRAAKARKEETS